MEHEFYINKTMLFY